jgi:hypothetical protein
MVHSYRRGGDKMKVGPVAGSMDKKEKVLKEKTEQKAMTISQSSVKLRW